MKKTILLSTIALATGLTCANAAITVITNENQVINPFPGGTVVKAVNVGGTGATSFTSTTGGITFEADTASGNGYTSDASAETAGSPSIIHFDGTSMNIKASDSIVGDQITIALNTDYVFEVYFMDNNAGRSADVVTQVGTETAVTQAIIQNAGLKRVDVAFNSGTHTTFDWSVVKGSNAGHAKVASYALYQAVAVPEPSSAALLGLGGLALILRRRK